MTPSKHPDDLGSLTRDFLDRYGAMGSAVPASQALVEALREHPRVRRIVLRWSSDWARKPHCKTIIWDRAELPATAQMEDTPLTHEAGATHHILSPPTQAVLALWIYLNTDERTSTEPDPSIASLISSSDARFDKDELQTLVDIVRVRDTQPTSPSRTPRRIPLDYDDDLHFLQEHLRGAYRRYREIAYDLRLGPQPVDDSYCFFLLYESAKAALAYPVARFYRLTDAGTKHISLHLTETGGTWDLLDRRDTLTAKRLLVDIFREALDCSQNGNLQGIFTTTSDGTTLEVSRRTGDFDSHHALCTFLSNWLLNENASDAPLARWKQIVSTSHHDAASELLAAVLRELPQSLSVGFATRCLLTPKQANSERHFGSVGVFH